MAECLGSRQEEEVAAWSGEVLSANGSEDKLRVDDFFVQLLAKEEGVSQEVVDHPGVALGMAVDSGECGRVDDGIGTAGAGNFVADIGGNLGIGKAGEIVMDGDALAECLMDGLA